MPKPARRPIATRPTPALVWQAVPPLCLALLLAACGTPPRTSGRDGAEARPPAGLEQVPDAVPRVEPISVGGPNKPYEVDGRTYVPLTGDVELHEIGLASWYGRKFHGRDTATGEPYDMYAMTAAHRTMPLPSYARVRNPANGREVIVRVNDRGPFRDNRVIDLSYTAALKLGLLGGVAPVEVDRITFESIRTGSWRPAAADRSFAQAADPAPDGSDPIAEFARRIETAPAAVPAPDPPAAATPAAASAGGFWVQLGAFRERDGAAAFRQQVAREADWLAPLLAIFDERSVHRLQAGPYANRSDASAAAERVRTLLQLTPTIVERR